MWVELLLDDLVGLFQAKGAQTTSSWRMHCMLKIPVQLEEIYIVFLKFSDGTKSYGYMSRQNDTNFVDTIPCCCGYVAFRI